MDKSDKENLIHSIEVVREEFIPEGKGCEIYITLAYDENGILKNTEIDSKILDC